LDGKHVVFGKVIGKNGTLCALDDVSFLICVSPPMIDGLDVVDKIEMVGSQSGATSKSVIVKESGELPE
jgi:cyclophilin family peptidyl-prolyl cis-trans isomerase